MVRNLKVGSHQDLNPASVNPGLTASIMKADSSGIKMHIFGLFFINLSLCTFKAIIEEHEKYNGQLEPCDLQLF